MSSFNLYQIMDVNFNRSREGLRVCEEFFRFIVKDRNLTAYFKSCRHQLTNVLVKIDSSHKIFLEARNVRMDFAKKLSPLEMKRQSIESLYFANIQRAKESVRVLEECLKLSHPSFVYLIKKIRFQIYDLEKKSLPKLETLRHHR